MRGLEGNESVDLNNLNYAQRDRLNKYLDFLVQNGGSDLHIKSNAVIHKRVHGDVVEIDNKRFLSKKCHKISKKKNGH